MGRHLRKVTAADRMVGVPPRSRRLILVGWLIVAALAGLFARGLPDQLSGGGWSVPGSESERAAALAADGFQGRGASTVTLVVTDTTAEPGSAEFDSRVGEAIASVAGDPTLDVRSRYGWGTLSAAARAPFVGADGRTVIEYLALGLADGDARRELPAIQSELTARFAPDGLEVILVGTAAFWAEVNALSESGLVRAELITLPLLMIILVLLYGGVMAAVVSLVVAGSSIVFTSALLSVVAAQVELSVFVQNTATMLGLGIGVDYSLFMISRYREELRAGRDVDAAVAVAVRTSGRTVLASGATVVLALASLFFIPLNVVASIALGGIVVVAFSVFVTTVLLPQLLRTLGRRIDAGRPPFVPRPSGRPAARWQRFALRIMRRPVVFLLISAAALAAAAAPSAQLRTFTPDARIVPTDSIVRMGYEQVADGFGPGATAPVLLVLDSTDPLTVDAAGGPLVQVRAALAALPGVTAVRSVLDVGDAVNPVAPAMVLDPSVAGAIGPDGQASIAHYLSSDGRRTVLEVVGTDYAASEASVRLLTDVRAVVDSVAGPWRSSIGGETAEGTDSNRVIDDHMIQVVAVMLLVVYLLLLITFRSVILPLKAILMNLLSLGATYGVLVLVFQHGWGGDWLGGGAQQVQNFVPVLLLALLFSLSTDYEVFLLERVREEYRATGDNERSVAEALARTAPLISGAAVLMIAVFGAFAFAAIMPMKQLGLGMAVAIAIDATLIRLVVVPASMRLLGRWNWWPGIRPPRRPRPPAPARRVTVQTPVAGTGPGTAEHPHHSDDDDSATPAGRHARVTVGS